MKEILNIIHKTIYQFFDVCGDDEEAPMSDRDKLLLEVNKAICNNLNALEQESKWVPVSERLPEIHQDVLLSFRSLDVAVGFRATTEPYFYCQGDYVEPQNVLAWMPKPEPYKEESEDNEWQN